MKTWSIVIQPFMINQLKLSGNELVAFAFVNGFSQAAGHGWQGALDTMAEHTGMSKKTCQRVLEDLVSRGYIQKLNRKTITEVNGKVYTNTLPLYIAVASEGESQIDTETDEKESEPSGEEPETSEEKPSEKPAPKPAPKSKESGKDVRFQQVKSNFKTIHDRLFSEGKIPTKEVCCNSALINKRLTDYFSRGITPAQIQATFGEMANDDFCVNQIKFDLAPMLSEALFIRWYNFTADKYKRLAAEQYAKKAKESLKKTRPVCPKCGETLLEDGKCPRCDINEIIENIR